ncbi:uncharacterized protein [Setaria viridis]|nr:uncharacterized protein LOC117843988 [Setaria viridis]
MAGWYWNWANWVVCLRIVAAKWKPKIRSVGDNLTNPAVFFRDQGLSAHFSVLTHQSSPSLSQLQRSSRYGAPPPPLTETLAPPPLQLSWPGGASSSPTAPHCRSADGDPSSGAAPIERRLSPMGITRRTKQALICHEVILRKRGRQASPVAGPCSHGAAVAQGADSAEVMGRRSSIAPCVACVLCGGLLRDAAVIPECLHSFCRECIVEKFTDKNINRCPKCDTDLGCNPLEKLRNELTDEVDPWIVAVERSKTRMATDEEWSTEGWTAAMTREEVGREEVAERANAATAAREEADEARALEVVSARALEGVSALTAQVEAERARAQSLEDQVVRLRRELEAARASEADARRQVADQKREAETTAEMTRSAVDSAGHQLEEYGLRPTEEQRTVAAETAEYVLACCLSRDPSFRLEIVLEGVAADEVDKLRGRARETALRLAQIMVRNDSPPQAGDDSDGDGVDA